MSDEAILKLASEGGLLLEADAVLRAELKRRTISAKDVRGMRLRQKQAELQVRVGNNRYHRGTGLRFRGYKISRKIDEGRDIVVMTRWIDFAYMPLIPIGSYRAVQSVGDGEQPKVVGKVKLQWDQVLDGWKRATIVALLYLALILATVLWFKYKG